MIANSGIVDLPPRLVNMPYYNNMDVCNLKCVRTMSHGITDVCMNFDLGDIANIAWQYQLTSPGLL